MRLRLSFLGAVFGALDTTGAFVAGAAGGCGVTLTLYQAGFE